jgi:prephenate dehydrogenase
MPDNRPEPAVVAPGQPAAFSALLEQGLLVVGCGLIGTSIAAAVRRAWPWVKVIGVETDDGHRRQAEARHVFDAIHRSLDDAPNHRYGIAVLAVPVHAAAGLLPAVARMARVVMDVCSVKQPICEAAVRHGLRSVFAPTHPMAGRAAGGPAHADAALFEGCAWLVLAEFPACETVLPLIRATGAVCRVVPGAREHDEAMAAVSHGVHLASLSVMLAYEEALGTAKGNWAAWTGPGFRDVTRLSGSPPGFWPETLRSNREAVLTHLDRLIAILGKWRKTLATDDANGLLSMLQEAQAAHERWERSQRDLE